MPWTKEKPKKSVQSPNVFDKPKGETKFMPGPEMGDGEHESTESNE